MARAQIALHNEFNAPIILQMHDEFLLEVPIEPINELPYWVRVTQEVMERPIPELRGASIKTDAEWGMNWGKQSLKNPNGIRKFDPKEIR